ncbi:MULTISPECIES: AraC family transcriptional regulator [unclassified Clostridium]|uniref:AraC family transcriptional regulator n=1 Tax=unclassified Clostridium TaxID=2614128 RepID=UPI00029867E7|nr:MULTISPECIES: AraC family transcriptional regulator [unclassified Clostridium]EKQ54450.1 MAG: DNA-binding domain-containing protein, AraC-type [Clostridium sp. Maddingley MBC34-26]
MESWEYIQRTINYIENSYEEKIEINNLAEIACLSPFYFQRLFSRLVGKSVMEYVKLRRLAKAAELLENTNCKILDIAVKVGFENHETFTRNFKEAYKLTPEAYRKQPRLLKHFNKPDISLKYRLIGENIPLVADGMVLEISRRQLSNDRIFAGISMETFLSNNPSINYLAELWNDFHSKKNSTDIFIKGGNEIGVGRPGTVPENLNYFVGAEVNNSDNIQNFEQFIMPSGYYIVCSFEAENFLALTTNALGKSLQYMYSIWFPNNKIALEALMVELYFDITPDSSYMETWFKIST